MHYNDFNSELSMNRLPQESQRKGISFIVTASNSSRTLVRCVQSIRNQTLDSLEIIIVDDGSTDATRTVAEDLVEQNQDYQIRYICHEDRKGVLEAKASGLRVAKYAYVWNIKAEDYIACEDIGAIILNELRSNCIPAILVPALEGEEGCDSSLAEYKSNILPKLHCTTATFPESDIDSKFTLVYDRTVFDELKIRDLRGADTFVEQVFLLQAIRKTRCIRFCNIGMYISGDSSSTQLAPHGHVDHHLKERILLNLSHQLGRDRMPEVHKWAFDSRFKTILRKLVDRPEKSLGSISHRILLESWKSDFRLLRPENSAVVKDLASSSILHEDGSSLYSLYEEIFADAEFVVHCGAHKTATTYVQGLLMKCRQDLALEGIVYIDYRQLRKELQKHGKKRKKDDRLIKSILVELTLPLLFRKPKRVIISDENLIGNNRSVGSRKRFACVNSWYNLDTLKQLLDVLAGSKVSLVYTIRDYYEWICSNYLEKIKWRDFASFDEYMGDVLNSLDQLSWRFIIKDLEGLKTEFKVNKVHIFAFEDIKRDLLGFAGFLAGISLENLDQSIIDDTENNRRSSPSIEALNLALEHKSIFGEESARLLYRKLIAAGFGKKRFKPELSKGVIDRLKEEYRRICIDIGRDCSSFTFSKRLESSFSVLARSISDYVATDLTTRECIAEDDIVLSKDAWKNSITSGSVVRLKNIEMHKEYNIVFNCFSSSKPTGISAMIRVKNEERNISKVILSCYEYFDEIMVIDNQSEDRTCEIVRRLQRENDLSGKIKLHSYPFKVARCGRENYECAEDSVHSLAYFYNYALSKCTFSHVFKWDGDMFMTDESGKNFEEFKKRYFKRLASSEAEVWGGTKGATVFKGWDNNYYWRPNKYENEIRLFSNVATNIFTKDVTWEKLYSSTDVVKLGSRDAVFIEMKDVAQQEFSHWDQEFVPERNNFIIGLRKQDEARLYTAISRLTKGGKQLSDEEMNSLGLQKLPDSFTSQLP